MNTHTHLKKGFTLIELLVVISIIAILVSMFLVNMVGVRERAADVRYKNNLKQYKTGLRLSYNDTGVYPASGNADPCPALASTYFPSGAPGLAEAHLATGDCRYRERNSRDGFVACVKLSSTAGTDDDDSRTACAASAAELEETDAAAWGQWYCVCSE